MPLTQNVSLYTQNQRDQVKIKIELLEQQKSREGQVRSRVKWVEEGEQKHKVFNLDKSRANSKIMERVTDDKGRTFTKHDECSQILFCLICIKRR